MDSLGFFQRDFEVGVSYSVCVDRDGSTIATTHGSKIRLWDPATKKITNTVTCRDASAVSFSPDGTVLVAMTTTGGGLVFDLAQGTPLGRFSGRGFGEGPGPVVGPCGTRFVLASWGGAVAVRSIDGAEVVWQERMPERRINQIACSPDRTIFALVGSHDDGFTVTVRRWPFDDQSPEDVLTLSGSHRTSKAIALDGNGRLAVRERTCLSVWDIDAGTCLAERPMNGSGSQEAVMWLADGQLVVTDNDEPRGSATKRVLLLAPDLTVHASLPLPYACALSCSESGELLVLGSWERKGLVLRRTPS